MRLKGILLSASAVGLVCGPALGRSFEVVGKAGYLSEWDVRAVVRQGGDGELSGPVTWKHTGLCTVNGPVEKSGALRFRISGWGPFAQIRATMSFESTLCSYSGHVSEETRGHMDCSDAKGIPLSLSIRQAEVPEPSNSPE